MDIQMRFDGTDLLRGLAALSTRVSRRLQREALREAAQPMRVAMSVGAPFDPKGDDVHLRDVMVISNARGRDAQEIAIAVGPQKGAGGHGVLQEFGTVHHAAQPFGRPAFDRVAPQSLRIISASLWREMARRGVSRTVTVDGPVEAGPGGGLL